LSSRASIVTTREATETEEAQNIFSCGLRCTFVQLQKETKKQSAASRYHYREN
jgi:hypothetical protein